MNIPKTYLTESVNVESKVILKILTQGQQLNEDDPEHRYYKKLAAWANENGRQQKLKNIDLDTIKLSDRGLITKNKMITKYTTLGHALLKLKNLMDQEGRYNPESELSRLIQLTTLEILGGLSGIKDKKDPEPPKPVPTESEPKPKADAGRDWTAYRAEKLAKVKPASKALDEFYDEYYSQEYAGVETPEKDTKGIVAKLKSLDKILIPEFNKLGYNPEVNPFASFLKILIKAREKSDIFDKLTYNTYGAIHNAFIDKDITGNMLGQKFDETNILFCSDLYSYKGLDMIEYLNLQKQAHNAKEGSKHSNVANLTAKIFIQQNIQSDESESNYASRVDKLLKHEDVIQPGYKDAKLKSLLEIRELYRYLFGAEAEKTKQKVNQKMVVEIVDEAERKNIILDMISHILDQSEYIDSENYAAEVQKFESWLNKHNYTRRDKNKVIESRKILSKYKLDAAAFSSIIKNLIRRVNEPAENKK